MNNHQRLDTEHSSAAAEASHNGIDPMQLVSKYKWLLLSGIVLGLVCGQLAYLQLGPQYDLVTQVLVSKRESTLDEEQDAKARSGERSEHIALIMSPMIIDLAVKNAQLDRLPSFADSDDVTDSILSGLKAKRSAGQEQSALNVIDIQYTSGNTADARVVLNAVIDAYEEYLREAHKDSTDELIELISMARDDVQARLAAKESEYLRFRVEAPLLWKNAPGSNGLSSDVTNIHRERVLAIEKERGEILLEQAELQSRIKSLQAAVDDKLPAELIDLMVQRAQIAETTTSQSAAGQGQDQDQYDALLLPLLMQRSELQRDFGPRHPKIREVTKRIEAIRSFYGQRGIRLPDADKDNSAEENSHQRAIDFLALLNQQMVELKDQDAQLAVRFKTESDAAKSFAVYQSRDVAMVDEIQHLKQLRDTVQSRVNISLLEKENTGYALKQISPIREELLIKRHLRFLISGLALGAMLSAAMAFMKQMRHTQIETVEEIQRRISLPILGTIPESVDGPERAAESGVALTYLHAPESVIAESYRMVRAALQNLDEQRQILAMISPQSGDGKSTLIGNLAIALAQSGRRVLLIDADLRSPILHRFFGLREEIGLSDVLEGEIRLENVIQSTNVNGLSVVTAGSSSGNPSELLSRGNLNEVLEKSRQSFDIILIDTPPVLAVSDACSIAQVADGLLLAIRLRKTDRNAAMRTLQIVDNQGTNVIGIIANGHILGAGQGATYRYAKVATQTDEQTSSSTTDEALQSPPSRARTTHTTTAGSGAWRSETADSAK